MKSCFIKNYFDPQLYDVIFDYNTVILIIQAYSNFFNVNVSNIKYKTFYLTQLAAAKFDEIPVDNLSSTFLDRLLVRVVTMYLKLMQQHHCKAMIV